MTLPFERTGSLVYTKRLLEDLLDPAKTPRVPRVIRGRAKSALRHFPMLSDIERAHKADPEVFGPVPAVTRLLDAPELPDVVKGRNPQPRTSEPASQQSAEDKRVADSARRFEPGQEQG